MNNSIKQKVIQEIRDEKIIPTSRMYFQVKAKVYFTLITLFIFLSALSFATTLFILFDQDYDIFEYLDKSLFSYTLSVIPYLWIFLILFFAFISEYIFINTKNGFKYKPIKILLSSTFAGMFFGFLIFYAGFGHIIHNRLVKDLPWYATVLSTKDINWSLPERGLLSGEIISMGTTSLTISDIYGKTWIVNLSDEMFGEDEVKMDEKVKFVGKIDSQNVFTAYDVRPWTE